MEMCKVCDMTEEIPCAFCSASKALLEAAQWPILEVKVQPIPKVNIGSGEDVMLKEYT